MTRCALLCAAFISVASFCLGCLVASNGYEQHIAEADSMLLKARGYDHLKACVDRVQPVRADLIGALSEARKFHGCVTSVFVMTEEVRN